MKRLLLLSAFVFSASLFLQAQSTDSTGGSTASRKAKAASPSRRAVRQLTLLQQQLNLSRDQVSKVHAILLNEDISLDSIRTNPSGNKKMDNQGRRNILQDADQKITALLTETQKPLYTQWKDEQRQKAADRRKTRGGAQQPPANP